MCNHWWTESTDPAYWYCAKCGEYRKKKTGE